MSLESDRAAILYGTVKEGLCKGDPAAEAYRKGRKKLHGCLEEGVFREERTASAKAPRQAHPGTQSGWSARSEGQTEWCERGRLVRSSSHSLIGHSRTL